MDSPNPLDDTGRPEVCPYDGEPCGDDCPAFNPCHAPLKAVEEVPCD